MMKLNKKIEYALMSLKTLHEMAASEKLSAKDIAERINAPFDVIARVLQVLAQKNLLDVERGVQGGYRIGKNLHEMTLKDLVEVIDGPIVAVKCQDHMAHCEIQKSCNILSPMSRLNSKMNDFYQNIKLDELLGEKNV
ncbi:MAG: RrF2 family transcriptional regulator [Pseudobdellovibrionaceae bacterium]|jgi:Rrf2 family iron-sulfur cluster assembly transcriptional regulator